MPDGSPIDQWWKSHRPVKVTTPANQRVCLIEGAARRTYCGRRPVLHRMTTELASVTCSECQGMWITDHPLSTQSSGPEKE